VPSFNSVPVVTVWLLLWVVCAVVLIPAETAIRGHPKQLLDPDGKNRVAEVSVEQPHNLTSGMIFVKEQDFYYSLPDWASVIRIPRVDLFLNHTTNLRNRLDELLNPAKVNVSASTRAKVIGMMDEVSAINKDLSTFRLRPTFPEPPA
jgi:hypothetical protein